MMVYIPTKSLRLLKSFTNPFIFILVYFISVIAVIIKYYFISVSLIIGKVESFSCLILGQI